MSLDALCGLFGFTRQGYWKQRRVERREVMDEAAVVSEVQLLRQEMPRLGVRKLQLKLRERGHEVGRDRLFSLLRGSGLLVKRKRYRAVTTDSRHWMRKWPNLIRGTVPTRPDELWVSDITYVEIWEGTSRRFMYLSLITDAYTHEIVGYALHGTLDTSGPLRALEKALSGRRGRLKGLTHHSDRGCQYCSGEYVETLRRRGIRISMTENGDPYENAVAERVNGILKTEWLYHMRLTSEEMARSEVDRIVRLYNTERPHASVGNLTPAEVRASAERPRKLWKNYGRLRQQAAGEESLSGALPADGRTVADAPGCRAEAVPT